MVEMKNVHTYTVAGIPIIADLTNDYYGESFWESAEAGLWELSTFGLVVLNVRKGTPFLDAGAASGIFSVLAATYGGHVYAIEPHPVWASCLRKNLELNNLSGRVTVLEAALSSENGLTSFASNRDTQILSNITLNGHPDEEQWQVPVVSLLSILDQITASSELRPVVKMDIEGAEYRTLTHAPTLHKLKEKEALLFLSLHPAFSHDKERTTKLGKALQSYSNYLKGFGDNLTLFKKLRPVAIVSTVIGKKVSSPLRFACLSLLGYDDFLIDFK